MSTRLDTGQREQNARNNNHCPSPDTVWGGEGVHTGHIWTKQVSTTLTEKQSRTLALGMFERERHFVFEGLSDPDLNFFCPIAEYKFCSVEQESGFSPAETIHLPGPACLNPMPSRWSSQTHQEEGGMKKPLTQMYITGGVFSFALTYLDNWLTTLYRILSN